MAQVRIPDGAVVGVLLNVPLDLIEQIEAWRAEQAVKPSRTKTLLYFIREGMAAAGGSAERRKLTND